ncbi:MAG: DUF2203 domain-containing protein [Acidimicrobiales bacterium]
MAPQTFTLSEARALLPDVRRTADRVIGVRADLIELTTDLARRSPSHLGGVPEAKALEAQLDDLLSWFRTRGIEVKGWAPLLLDFPGVIDDEPALLCWLEGEGDIAWYHRPEHGFAGRRRLPESLG